MSVFSSLGRKRQFLFCPALDFSGDCPRTPAKSALIKTKFAPSRQSMKKQTCSNPIFMAKETHANYAKKFRELHMGQDMLILPCAWNVASAKIFELQGFQAIGTTSAGIAASLGYPDGQKISFDEHLAIVRRIVQSITLPVTMDVEAGYGTHIEEVASNIKRVIESGVVGINIEDEAHWDPANKLETLEFMVEKIKAIKKMVKFLGKSLFINAKTDVYWLKGGEDTGAIFKEVTRRATAYCKAGADCIFVPGDLTLKEIVKLAKVIPRPLNIVVKDNTPPIELLQKVGVKRVSLGSGPMRATMGLTQSIAQEILLTGTYKNMLTIKIPFYQVKNMFGV